MRLDVDIVTLRRREPLISGRGSLAAIRQLFVRVFWDGRMGLGGSVLGRGAVAGAAERPVRAALDRCKTALHDSAPGEVDAVLDRCAPLLADHPAALAALDIALFDLLGQQRGLPLHALWDLDDKPLPPTAISIGAAAPAARVARARDLSAWPILKLKLTAADDLAIVAAIRAVYEGRLWIDANGGWTAEQAIAAAHRLNDLDVELLEQPVAPGCLEAFAAVHRASPIPLVADEDCAGPDDVARLRHCAGAINVKLVKCGGLRRARDTIARARDVGLRVMVGCKVESAVGVTAMAHLAGLADYADLDGHIGLVDDPYAGLSIDCGRVGLPGKPGLGAYPVGAQEAYP